MAGLDETITGLSRIRTRWNRALHAARGLQLRPVGRPTPWDRRLSEIAGFGPNPGGLRMFAHAPAALPPKPALVVVLHGCTQTAEAYDHGSGWSELADRHGFVLVCPEQTPANNPKRCFNWFHPSDVSRDSGEAASIRQMVATMADAHGVDPGRIFVTGLSAGGAMTVAMLATYPDVFAGGAVIAGLPYGGASSVPEASERMFQGASRPAREWGDLVRAASPHRGPWPRLSIWQGSGDTVVNPANAREIVKQWSDLHGLAATPAQRTALSPGIIREVWRDAAGADVIESYAIDGLGHGTPLSTAADEGHPGAVGSFMLEAGISSTARIARFFGLTDREITAARRRPAHPSGPGSFGTAINDALRAAGLSR